MLQEGDRRENRKTPLVSVIIPCYNEVESIGEVLNRLEKINNRILMEVTVVDDGSTDGTLDVVSHHPNVKMIKHGANLGKGSAIRTGLKNCSGEFIVIQDADMEYMPEEIPQLVQPLIDGKAEMVLGSRFANGRPKGMSAIHMLGNRTLSLVTSLLYGRKVTDVMTGHKAFTKDVIEKFGLRRDGFEVEVELVANLLKNGHKVVEVPIDYCYRNQGESKINARYGLTSLIELLMLRA